MSDQAEQLAGILERAEHVHAVVSEKAGGADPDWALFYVDHGAGGDRLQLDRVRQLQRTACSSTTSLFRRGKCQYIRAAVDGIPVVGVSAHSGYRA